MPKTKTVKKTIKKPAAKPVVKEVKNDMKEKSKKLSKIIVGNIVSVAMQKTVVVSITRKVPHKRYGKLMKVTKRIKADSNGMDLSLGDLVTIQQTKPISRGKFFKVIKKGEGAKSSKG